MRVFAVDLYIGDTVIVQKKVGRVVFVDARDVEVYFEDTKEKKMFNPKKTVMKREE